ncbi:MAG: MBL fold metallo-hydrolase [Pseudomonadota bacterium]
MDSSWWLQLQQTALCIDPWLVGSEIDNYKWLNEQWHVTPPVAPAELSKIDALLITQSYEDHCHLNTLAVLDENLPILATEKAYKRLNRVFPDRNILAIPNLPSDDWLTFGDLKLAALHPGRKLDPVYFGVIIAHGGQAIFYAPHGFVLNDAQITWLKKLQCKLLMTTFTDFQLPGIMGGKVNLGLSNAKTLAEQLQAVHVLNTHDEPKKAKGLVSRLAKVTYADLATVDFPEPAEFIPLPDYRTITIS